LRTLVERRAGTTRAGMATLAIMGAIETALAAAAVAALTYFAYTAAGDDFPLNVAVAALAFVVAGALMLRVLGRGPL
jgi:4-hydroxybenzoate polyprenyltransferase